MSLNLDMLSLLIVKLVWTKRPHGERGGINVDTRYESHEILTSTVRQGLELEDSMVNAVGQEGYDGQNWRESEMGE